MAKPRTKHKARVNAAQALQKVQSAEAVHPSLLTHLLDMKEIVTEAVVKLDVVMIEQQNAKRENQAENRLANESRARMHERIDGVADRVGALGNEVSGLAGQVSRITPLVDAAEEKRQQRVGAAALKKRQLIVIRTGIGAIAGIVPWAAARWTAIGDWIPAPVAKWLLIRS